MKRPTISLSKMKETSESLFSSCHELALRLAERRWDSATERELARLIDNIKTLRPFINTAKTAQEHEKIQPQLKSIETELRGIEARLRFLIRPGLTEKRMSD